MSELIKIWEDMGKEKGPHLIKRLFVTVANIPVYAIYSQPTCKSGIAFSFNDKEPIDTERFTKFQELKICIAPETSYANRQLLLIELTNNANIRLFATLCQDLINTKSDCKSESKAVRCVLNQIERWNKLFGKSRSNLLSDNAQLGLYGELYFLRKLLQQSKGDVFKVMHTWTGVEKTNKDFQGKDWAVEVKTTKTNNPSTVEIHGERQLDNVELPNMYLDLLSLNANNSVGEKVPEIVISVRELISDDVECQYLYEAKLQEVDYCLEHEKYYMRTLYQLRKETIYQVAENFPRIVEADLRDGVTDVNYKISLSHCDEFQVPWSALLSIINF